MIDFVNSKDDIVVFAATVTEWHLMQQQWHDGQRQKVRPTFVTMQFVRKLCTTASHKSWWIFALAVTKTSLCHERLQDTLQLCRQRIPVRVTVRFSCSNCSNRNKHRVNYRIYFENLSFGSRAFRVSAPKVWNFLPFQIRQSRVTSHIQTPFKDTLFSVSLSHYLGPRPCALILFQTLALYKSFT